VLFGSNRWDANSSPHLLTIVVRSSSRVVPSGTESSTSPLPRIFFSVRIVRTLSVINSKPSCLLMSVLRSRKATFSCNKIDWLSANKAKPYRGNTIHAPEKNDIDLCRCGATERLNSYVPCYLRAYSSPGKTINVHSATVLKSA